jgi:thiamine kinase-like enzyme
MIKIDGTPESYAQEIIKSELQTNYQIIKISSFGTRTKNYLFEVKENNITKYILKLHGAGKPRKEKNAGEFYKAHCIVQTPEILSIGNDYTLTHFEKELEGLSFTDHILSLAEFHKKLADVNHEGISRNELFRVMSRGKKIKTLGYYKESLEGIVSYNQLLDILSDLPNPEGLGIKPCLIHGDPHNKNLLRKNGENFFLDLEHTIYERQTVDLARCLYSYPPSEFSNILALYLNHYGKLPEDLSRRDFLSILLSDMLLEGAITVISCKKKSTNNKVTERWINGFSNYFDYIKNI